MARRSSFSRQFGTWGNDTLNGGALSDWLFGLAGDDKLSGGAGNDFLIGGSGNDHLDGGEGNDVLIGDGFGFWWNRHNADDTLIGGAGSDTVLAGRGNDEAIYQMALNDGSHDRYNGGSGIDTLTLTFTRSEWMREDVQADIAAYQQFLSDNTNTWNGQANGRTFQFSAFGLDASRFENLKVIVDDEELDGSDEPVTAVDDMVSTSEDSDAIEFSSVLANDIVPDLVKAVRLVSGPSKGVLVFNEGAPGAPDGSFSFDPAGGFNDLNEGDVTTVSFIYEVEDANGDVAQATVTIKVTGTNGPPVVTPIEPIGIHEDMEPITINLLAGASDPDLNDDLDVANVIVSSDRAGPPIALDLNPETGELMLDPRQFNDLAVNETVTLTINYNVVDGKGGITPNTVVIVIEGRNDAPTVVPILLDPLHEDAAPLNFSLLDNAQDADVSDVLNITHIEVTSSNSERTVLWSLGQAPGDLLIDPAQFNDLPQNATETITVEFDVYDSNGGVAHNTATLVVEGRNDAPAIITPPTAVADTSEDDAPITFNLLNGTDDPDNTDIISLRSVLISSDNSERTVAFDYDRDSGDVTIDPAQFNDLSVDTSETLTVSYAITDSKGGFTENTVPYTFEILGANDDPDSTPLVATTNEDAGPFTIDLLQSASDPDKDDQLFIGEYFVSVDFDFGNNTLEHTLLGGNFRFDTSQFNYLAAGETATVSVGYDISDGHGGSTPESTTITIEGRNDPLVITQIETSSARTDEDPLVFDLRASAVDPDVGPGVIIDLLFTDSTLPDHDLQYSFDAATGEFSIDPDQFSSRLGPDETAAVSVVYSAEGDNGDQQTGSFTITVQGVADVTIEEDAETSGNLLDFIPLNPDESFVEGSFVTDHGGQVTIAAGGSYTYKPAAGYNGYDSIPVQVQRDGGDVVFPPMVAPPVYIDIGGGLGGIGGGSSSNNPTSVTEDSGPVQLSLKDSSDSTISYGVLSVSSSNNSRTVEYSQHSSEVSINPAQFNDLAQGESEKITIRYVEKTGNTGEPEKTIFLTVHGRNDTPTAVIIDAGTHDETDGPIVIDLTGNSTDPDTSDGAPGAGSVKNIVVTSSNDQRVVNYTSDGQNLTIDPSQFEGLDGSSTEKITVSYDITDSNGGVAHSSAKLIVAGENTAPSATPDKLVDQMTSKEFLVMTDNPGGQASPDMATLANGNVAHVSSYNGNGIALRIVDTLGQAQTNEIKVNEQDGGSRGAATVAALADGRLVVTWHTSEQIDDTEGYGIKARIFYADGVPAGEAFLVNDTTAGNQLAPTVTGLESGGFVVTWFGGGIKAQRFDNDGVKLGNEITVDEENVTSGGTIPSVSAMQDGGFAVSWNASTHVSADMDGDAVFAQIFDASGEPTKDAFLVNSATAGNQWASRIETLASGRLIVTWQSFDSDPGTPDFAIKARLFTENGRVLGNDLLVSSVSKSSQDSPDITALTGGGFVITWQSDETSADGIIRISNARIYDASGNPVSDEFQINETISGGIYSVPAVTALSNGGFMISSTFSDTNASPQTSEVKARVFDANGQPVTEGLVREGAVSVIDISGLTANDSDVDGDTLEITAVAATSTLGASLTFNTDGTVSYDPTSSDAINALELGETVEDTFSYTITDPFGASDTADVTVIVTGTSTFGASVVAATSFAAQSDMIPGTSLEGTDQDEALVATNGDDVITGAGGDDTLTGLAGGDIFVFNLGDGSDAITDFAAGAEGRDVLRLIDTGFADAQAVISAAQDVGDNVEITIGTDIVTLLDVQVAQFNVDDFHIV